MKDLKGEFLTLLKRFLFFKSIIYFVPLEFQIYFQPPGQDLLEVSGM